MSARTKKQAKRTPKAPESGLRLVAAPKGVVTIDAHKGSIIVDGFDVTLADLSIQIDALEVELYTLGAHIGMDDRTRALFEALEKTVSHIRKERVYLGFHIDSVNALIGGDAAKGGAS